MKLGSVCFICDGRADSSPIVCIPTQRIRERVYELIRSILEKMPPTEAWELARIVDLFETPADRRSVQTLAKIGYLEIVEDDQHDPIAHAAGAGNEAATEKRTLGLAHSRTLTRFDEDNRRHYFREPTFFNVPKDVEDRDAEVGLIGIPFSSAPDSVGTEMGPHFLRMLTQQTGSWHAIHEDGVYTELRLDGGLPTVLGKGIVIKDYGDLGQGVRTVDDLMQATQASVQETFVSHGIRPIFVGGDHAITFPIVHAFIEQFPDLALIHLDAHNDLFYSNTVLYNHAATVSNLLVYSRLSSLHSFGLRTHFDTRAGNVRGIAEHPGALRDKIHLHSIADFRRFLAVPDSFIKVLREIGDRPCYLTIDLDVLTPAAIGGRLSTPAGPGLEWVELFEAVGHVLRELNVVGADIVELNVPRGDQPQENPSNAALLTLLLIQGLAEARRKG